MKLNRDDVIRWAREAGGLPDPMVFIGAYERFAALVAAAEREACAKVCEAMRPTEQEYDQRFYTACTLNANAIRNRGIE